ncbi:MAG TPA: LLM class flavin-dependent oxidoreductase [Chloroflexota bacterium]
MPVEFIGMIATQEASEVLPPQGPLVDADFTARFAQVHEEGGFDRILIGYGSRWPDGWQVANHAVRATERLKILLAHRPGFVAPTLTARQAVTFEHLTGAGRLALHIITGGDEADQRREGDFLSHDERYRRTAEYMHALRLLWESPTPVEFAGEFYRFEDAQLLVRPPGSEGIPLFFGGASAAAVDVGARFADVFMLWGEPLAFAAERLGAIRAAASAVGRKMRFSLSVRPILAPTEAAAWARAEDIAERALAQRQRFLGARGRRDNSSVGSARLLEAAASADVHDTRLWTRIAAITGAAGNSTALVGTPEQVAESLLAYVDLGFDTLLIRGFHPFQDAIDYGRELIPLVRSEVARRERDCHPEVRNPRASRGASRAPKDPRAHTLRPADPSQSLS